MAPARATTSTDDPLANSRGLPATVTCTGMRQLTSVPTRGSLRTSNWPPSCSTIRRSSHHPVGPPVAPVSGPANGAYTADDLRRAPAWPGVADQDVESVAAFARLHADAHHDVARQRRASGGADDVGDDALPAPGVAEHGVGQVGCGVEHDVDAARGVGRLRLDDLLEQRPRREGRGVGDEGVPGEQAIVLQPIEQAERASRRRLHRGRVLPLLAAEGGVEQEAGHAEQAGQRRPQLAHRFGDQADRRGVEVGERFERL